MDDITTHRSISRALCGTPAEVDDGRAAVRLEATEAMAVDERGLIHGGFVFGAADYAAMLAVNEPHVVLGAADCRFLAPVKVGDILVAEARVTEAQDTKRLVTVTARVDDREVFKGSMVTFALDRHVLDR